MSRSAGPLHHLSSQESREELRQGTRGRMHVTVLARPLQRTGIPVIPGILHRGSQPPCSPLHGRRVHDNKQTQSKSQQVTRNWRPGHTRANSVTSTALSLITIRNPDASAWLRRAQQLLLFYTAMAFGTTSGFAMDGQMLLRLSAELHPSARASQQLGLVSSMSPPP